MLLLLLPLLGAGEWGAGRAPGRGSPGSLPEDPGYKLQVQGLVTVQEGLCAHVPCAVSYPRVGGNDSASAHGSWYRTKPDRKEVLVATSKKKKAGKPPSPFSLSGNLSAGSCSLRISGPRLKDSGEYYFRLERGGHGSHSFLSNPLTVTVTELTHSPRIHVEEPLESGRPSRLTCSMPGACDGATPPIISWTGAALGAGGLDLGAYNSSGIVLRPCPQDHGTSLTCRVTLPGARVGRESTVMLNVSYAPQSLAISASRGNRGNRTELESVGNGSSLWVREGDSLRLLCVADSNPPATLSWAQGGRTLSPSPPWKPGVLELRRVEPGHEGEFTCWAQHPRGSLRASLRLRVQTPLQLLGPSCSWEAQGLSCSCSSRALPAPSLRWRLGERLLEGNQSGASYAITSRSAGPWTNSSLSLSGGLSAGLTLSCEAGNVHGAQSAAVLRLPEKPALGEAFALGAVGGAGVVGLLSLCLAFTVKRVKTRRKHAPEAAAAQKDAPSARGPIPSGYQRECPPGSHLDAPPPAPAAPAPAPGEELELHYAALSFPGLRPGEPRDQAAPCTEYAEIKIRR